MLSRHQFLLKINHSWTLISSCTMKHYALPPEANEVEFPESRKLKFYPKVPIFPMNVRPAKHPKRLSDMRGPELVHNKLLYKQFGIMALAGGLMKHEHFETIRYTVNRRLDVKNMFAVWRVDPPWKARTKKGQGRRMGGGKGSIHHYVTPVKAGRIIIETGGTVELAEVYPFLKQVIVKLPFPSAIVSEEILADEMAAKKLLQERNENPYTLEYLMKNRMLGCAKWLNRYDRQWHGTFI